MKNEKGSEPASSGTEEVSANTKPTWLDKWRNLREAPPPPLDENDPEIQERVAKAIKDRGEADVPTEVPFGQFRRGD